ncbi:NAD(P)-dependent oxidoreductase [Candidatus Pelagibacter bacterium]|nr:NAD(P)-dependent oxidoreductase [Candidatus Pelagibacter bacterium]
MKKIAVIGGSGFIGKSLCKELSKKNFVLNIDMKSLEGVPNVKTKIINIKNKKKLISALKGIDYVFHLAGVSDLHKAYINPKKTAEFNIIGTINVLDACVKNKVKKIIFSSSLYSFTEEGGFYKSSKLSAEFFIYEYFKKHKLQYTILRFGSIYGEYSNQDNKLFNIMHQAIKDKKIIFHGLKKSVRKYIYVTDAAKLCIKAVDRKFNQKILMITGQTKTKINDLLMLTAKTANINEKYIKFIDKKLLGHYIIEPKKFSFPEMIFFKKKNEIRLNEGLDKLYNYIKKEVL